MLEGIFIVGLIILIVLYLTSKEECKHEYSYFEFQGRHGMYKGRRCIKCHHIEITYKPGMK